MRESSCSWRCFRLSGCWVGIRRYLRAGKGHRRLHTAPEPMARALGRRHPCMYRRGRLQRYRVCVSPQIDARQQEEVIQRGFEELIQENDFVVVEGTGHTGER